MGFLRFSLLLLPLVLLGGCFEYDEDVFVHKDGTGRLKMDQGIHKDLLDEETLAEARSQFQEYAKSIAKLEEVTKAEYTDYVREDMQHFVFDIHVTDYHFIGELLRNEDLSRAGFLGVRDDSGAAVRFEKLENGNIQFQRLLDSDGSQVATQRSRLSKLTRQDKIRNLMVELSGKRGKKDEDPLAGKAFTFRFHAPKIVKQNAPGKTSGGTVEWRLPLDDEELEVPPQLEAEFGLQSFEWWWLIAGGVVFFLGLMWLRDRWRKGFVRKAAQRSGLI